MDFKFSKGSSDAPQQESHGEKKNQNALLVLLLLLVGGFSYIYFFTGLIKPSEAPKPADAPAPPVVKMPLPSRDGNASTADVQTKDKGDEASQAKTQSPKPVQIPPVATLAPAAPATKAPTPQTVKPKEESPKSETGKAAGKKAQPAAVAEKKAQKAAVAKVEEKKPAAEKKPTPAVKKFEPAKPADKKVAAEKTVKSKKTVTAATAVAKEGAGNAWSVMVGQYVLEEALSTDMGRVRKAGFEPQVQAGARKKTSMNRLMFAEFADRTGAQAAIAKLKRHTSDAFILDQAGKHVVYAGSYLLDARAASEKDRLVAAGFPVTLKRTEIAIPTQSLTIGPFSEKKAADAALDKLKGTGVKATLIHQ